MTHGFKDLLEYWRSREGRDEVLSGVCECVHVFVCCVWVCACVCVLCVSVCMCECVHVFVCCVWVCACVCVLCVSVCMCLCVVCECVHVFVCCVFVCACVSFKSFRQLFFVLSCVTQPVYLTILRFKVPRPPQTLWPWLGEGRRLRSYRTTNSTSPMLGLAPGRTLMDGQSEWTIPQQITMCQVSSLTPPTWWQSWQWTSEHKLVMLSKELIPH